MPKRAAGEGTIHQRKDGRWQGQLHVGYSKDGKRIRKSVYGQTQREVREKLEYLKRKAALGDLANSKHTVATYLAYWLKEKSRNWKPRTLELYRHYADAHIIPHLGHVKLSALKPMHVQSLVGQLADAGTIRTANACRTLLYSALKQAVRWELLHRNVVEAVDPVRDEPKQPDMWTPEQTMTFLKSIEGHRLYAAFYVLITTGLRRGELLGLRWQDLKGAALHVEQALTLHQNTPVISTPKTKRGQRVVAIHEDTRQVLAAHRERQEAEKAYLGDAWTDTGLVFTSEIGTPIHPRNFYRTWRNLQDKAGVPAQRIHDLRHLHASLLIRQGLDPKVISDRLGHTDPAFTMRRYAHLFEDHRQKAALSLDTLLGATNTTDEDQNI